MIFTITDELKQLLTKDALLDKFNSLSIQNYSIKFSKFDIEFNPDDVSIDDFIQFAASKQAVIYYYVQKFSYEDFLITKDSGLDTENVCIWERCTSDYECAILNRINNSLIRFGKLPNDEDIIRHAARKDSGAIIEYNKTLVESDICNYNSKIELYCEVNGKIFKLSKSININPFINKILLELEQIHQEVKDEVDDLINQDKQEEPVQTNDDDEFTIDEPVENVFVKTTTEEE